MKANNSRVDHEALKEVCKAFLLAVGEDPERPGLLDTPRRFADHWREFFDYDPGRTETVFDSLGGDEMVVAGPTRVESFCEHHLLPFNCDIHIGYIASNKVMGLSKLPRIAHQFAHRLQIQERLVMQIGREVMRVAGCEDVAVVGRGTHSCACSRGVKARGLMMTCSFLHGRFKHDSAMRSEFMSFVSSTKS
jgi:GTP cyclohydrolase I